MSKERYFVSKEPDSILYIFPGVIESRQLKRAQAIVDMGKTVEVHYHHKREDVACTEDCMIMEPENE